MLYHKLLIPLAFILFHQEKMLLLLLLSHLERLEVQVTLATLILTQPWAETEVVVGKAVVALK
jgi:hypothetical protein